MIISCPISNSHGELIPFGDHTMAIAWRYHQNSPPATTFSVSRACHCSAYSSFATDALSV